MGNSSLPLPFSPRCSHFPSFTPPFLFPTPSLRSLPHFPRPLIFSCLPPPYPAMEAGVRCKLPSGVPLTHFGHYDS